MILECVYNSAHRNVTTFVSKLLNYVCICYYAISYCREENLQETKCASHFCFIILPQTFLFASVKLIHRPMMNG